MSDQLETMAPASVQVDGASQGSGTIVRHAARSTYVLTCYHVVGTDKPTVTVMDGKRPKVFNGKTVHISEEHDLALVKTTRKIDRPALGLSEEDPDVFDKVWVLGCPGGWYGTPGEGIIAQVDDNLYRYTGLAMEGLSGGTMCDLNGELVGVPSKLAHYNGQAVNLVGWAVSRKVIKDFLEAYTE